ncbi:MAG: SDR family oxidoreductase, partial [Firmicutes bacterium]|nr:SDR family oxidoreductase [Bacillota bacterium]
ELAMPEDLADAILFLASDQSRYVNGEELKCDGGWTCF